jgi:hypothetical protein
VDAAERLHETERVAGPELRVAREDHQEVLVARRELEAVHAEDGVIGHREAVQDDHPEDRRDSRHEDRAFERDRDERDPAVRRPAADVEGVLENGGPVLQAEASEAADEPADQDEERHAGRAVADRVVELLDRVRRVGLHHDVALRARAVHSLDEGGRARELGNDAVEVGR